MPFCLGMFRLRRALLLGALLFTVACLWRFHSLLNTTRMLLSLPLIWGRGSDDYIISAEKDGFDVTFANYSTMQTTAGEGYTDEVPAILHHIMFGLGSGAPSATWNVARQSCLDFHPDWEHRLWNQENATNFIAEKFPDFKPTWDGYELDIQRIDTLRYLVLYEYGGVILDMDLQCKRSVGPLRRFSFVAPAAYPTGFSVSFMMASKHNEFIMTLIQNLKKYNRQWFKLPYPTVMFSTGGHFASVIHAMQPNRSESRILAGPKDNFKLHSLNGKVSTPLFVHLGSSSWHSFDGLFIMSLGKNLKWMAFGVIVGVVIFTGLVMCLPGRGFRKWRAACKLVGMDVEKRAA